MEAMYKHKLPSSDKLEVGKLYNLELKKMLGVNNLLAVPRKHPLVRYVGKKYNSRVDMEVLQFRDERDAILSVENHASNLYYGKDVIVQTAAPVVNAPYDPLPRPRINMYN